jgi:hypothetical protein
LSYLDEKSNPPKWKCVDECLQEKDGYFCGETDHFTSFAILLGGSGGGGGGSGGCGSSSTEFSTIGWLSLAAVLAALLVVILVVLANESYHRYKSARRWKEERNLSSKLSLVMQQAQYSG